MKLFLQLPQGRPASLCLPLFLFLLFIMTGAHAQAPLLTLKKELPRDTTQRIVYGNSTFLACMVSPARLFSSTDGASWVATTSPDFGHSAFIRPAFAYGAGLFVCVADSGKIFTSPDATTWTRRNSGKTATFHDVQFLQNTFYAVGDSATFLYSTDGINWVPSTTGLGATSDSYTGVAFGNGAIVITATSASAGTVLYRGDASTLGSWTADTIADVVNLQFLNDRFYLFTFNGTFTSSDAVNWTFLPLPTVDIVSNGFYDGSQYYLLSSATNTNGTVGRGYSSADGVTFTNLFATFNELNAGLYANQHYLIYGDDGMLNSPDGANYTPLGEEFNALASNGNGYLGVGSSDFVGLFFVSPDCSTWTSTAPGTEIGNYGALYDGSRYLVSGNDGANSAIWASPDGLTWSAIGPQTIRGQGTPDIVTIAYGAGQYLGLGKNGLSSSTDGANWAYITGVNQLGLDFLKIKFVNGYFFAMADSPTASGTKPALLATQDLGSQWQHVTPNLPFAVQSFNDIVYDSATRQFTIMGMDQSGGLQNQAIVLDNTSNPAGFFSISTSNIADPSSYGAKGTVTSPPAGAALRGASFAYSKGYFVGGALDTTLLGSGYLLYSTDALHWNSLPLGIIGGDFIGNVSSADTFRLLTKSNVQLTANFSGIALPITLLNLNATVVGTSALLTWQTASEQNSLQFVVQRSPDAIQWDSIGSVAAAGQSDITRNYNFTDAHPQNGYDYYRLTLVDIDGSRQFSPVKSVWIGQGAAFRIYPNPAGSRVTLQLPESAAGTAVLYDASGNLVAQQEFSGNTVNFSLQGLPAGVYHLWALQNGKQYVGEVLH
jgi:photosystem II stability/assembly factor-like uncharacterized protein